MIFRLTNWHRAVSNYSEKMRLTEISIRKGRPVKPSTVNRDVANLRAMLNKAVVHSKIDTNPIGRIRHLEENNVRKRLLES